VGPRARSVGPRARSVGPRARSVGPRADHDLEDMIGADFTTLTS
jgi:hypothetical protein